MIRDASVAICLYRRGDDSKKSRVVVCCLPSGVVLMHMVAYDVYLCVFLSPKVAPPSVEALNITSQLPDLLVHHIM